MTIDTGSHEPIKLKPYRAPLNQRKIIGKTIEDLLAANIIKKLRSGWAAPIIIVKKKDNTPRMCVDYRALNKTCVEIMKKNQDLYLMQILSFQFGEFRCLQGWEDYY